MEKQAAGKPPVLVASGQPVMNPAGQAVVGWDSAPQASASRASVSRDGVHWNDLGRATVDVSISFRPNEEVINQVREFTSAVQAISISFQAVSVSVHPLMLCLVNLGNSLTALLLRLKGKSLPTGTGRILYIADDAGNVHVGGYVENLEWLHGLLELRYGAALVSAIDEGPVRFFVFQKQEAWQKNSRWSMYTQIPETGDPQLWETGYHSQS